MGVEAARLALRSAPARRPRPSGWPRPRPPTWTRPTPPPSTPPSASRRVWAPSTSAAHCGRGRARCRPRCRDGDRAPSSSWSRPTCATGCPPRPTRPPAATARRPCWWPTTRPGSTGHRRVPRGRVGDRRVPRPLASAGPAPVAYLGGALRRDALPAPGHRGLGGGSQGRRPVEPTRSVGPRVTGMHGRAVRSAGARLGLERRRPGRRPRLGGRPVRHGPPAARRWHPCSRPPDPTRSWLFSAWPTEPTPSSSERRRPAPRGRRRRPWPRQLSEGAELPYGKFLAWRDMVAPEPPRRPEPGRVSSSAAWRSEAWKFGFVGSRDRTSEVVHLPAGPRLDDGRCGRRHGPGRPGRHGGHHRHLHRRPPGLFAEPAHRLRRRRLRRRRPFSGRAHRRRRRPCVGGRPRDDDLPSPLQRGRHPRLLLEGQAGVARIAQPAVEAGRRPRAPARTGT